MTGIPLDKIDNLKSASPSPAAPLASGTTLASPAPWFVNWANGNPGGESAPVVNEITMLNYLAVYSCVSLIAGCIASLPLITYRRNEAKRTRVRATDANVYRVLRDEFNPRMSSAVARETMTGHLLTWGNEFGQIVRNKSGSEVLQINPLGPDVIDVRIENGAQAYDVYERGTGKILRTLAADEMIHVPSIGYDGICGYAQARIARDVIRAGMSADREAERFASRGFRPPGAIKMPLGKKFGSRQEAIKFQEDFKQIHMSTDGATKVVVLQDGAEWQDIGVSMEAAQMLEGRQFTRGEIAGMYKVPPHMIGDVEKSTSWGTGIAEQVDGFVKFTLMSWLVKKEQEYNRKLFGGSAEMYAEHLLEALERADIVKRTQAIKEQILMGMRSPNEGRELENMNPREGGDVYLLPLNYMRVDADGNDIPPPAPAAPPPSPGQSQSAQAATPAIDAFVARIYAKREQIRASLRKAVVAATLRCLRKEGEQAKRAAAKPAEFCAWLDEFYGRHTEMVADALQPLAEAWDAAIGAPPFGVVMHVERSRADLLAAADGRPSAFAERVEKLAARWLSERAVEVAGDLYPVETAKAV